HPLPHLRGSIGCCYRDGRSLLISIDAPHWKSSLPKPVYLAPKPPSHPYALLLWLYTHRRALRQQWQVPCGKFLFLIPCLLRILVLSSLSFIYLFPQTRLV